MSAIATEDILEFSADYAKDQSELLFTTLPGTNAESRTHLAQSRAEQTVDGASRTEPDHITYLKKKLKLQQRRKKLLFEEQERLEELNTALTKTESLNSETEQRNVQAAVLMSALDQLQKNFEHNQSNYAQLLSDTKELQQNSLEISHSLQDVYRNARNDQDLLKTNNSESKTLISEISKELKIFQARNEEDQSITEKLHSTLEKSQLELNNIQDKAKLFGEAKLAAEICQQRAEDATTDNESKNKKLTKLLEKNSKKSEELEELAASLFALKAELISERDRQRELNKQSQNTLVKSEALNQQQTTLIELANSRTQELEQELKDALTISKKYQTKLSQTEIKLRESSQAYEKLKSNISKSANILQRQKQALNENTDALKLSVQQNTEFNAALRNFQQSSDQSQQLVLRSQSTLQNVFSRNDLLEKENRLLRAKLNALPSLEQFRTTNQLSDFEETTLHNMAQDTTNRSGAKTGFYSLMTALTVILPLSLILHNMFSSAGEVEPEMLNTHITQFSDSDSLSTTPNPFIEPQTIASARRDSTDSLSSNGL